MKRLISPPIQGLFWLGSLLCLTWGAWTVFQLRMLDEGKIQTAPLKVAIPEVASLQLPPVGHYQKLVEAPLFWEARRVPKREPPPPSVVATQVIPEPPREPLKQPEGRLVGIIDPGNGKFAVVRAGDKKLSLKLGDEWEGWTVDKIDGKRLLLVAQEQQVELPLIADFAAPAENAQTLRQRHKQLATLRQRQQQNRPVQTAIKPASPEVVETMNGLIPVLEPVAESSSNVRENPVMSIKEALEARQRLMAARWGGSQNKAVPPKPPVRQ